MRPCVQILDLTLKKDRYAVNLFDGTDRLKSFLSKDLSESVKPGQIEAFAIVKVDSYTMIAKDQDK